MLTISDSPFGLVLTLSLGEGTWLSPIPLRPGSAERTLLNTCIALRAAIAPIRIAEHITRHDGLAESSCPCCKLEGRTLRGQGRRALSQEDRLRAASHSSGSQSVQIRHFRTGLSGSELAS